MGQNSSLYWYKYPHPAVAVDCVIVSYSEVFPEILLIKRRNPPYHNRYALPGGFVDPEETTLEAAQRELFEETGIQNVQLYETKSYSNPHRDPRERVISIAYLTLINKHNTFIEAGDDAQEAVWKPLNNLPPLAFDHNKIIEDAMEKLKHLLFSSPILFYLLPDSFTSTEIKTLLRNIINQEISDIFLKNLLEKFCTSHTNKTGEKIFNFTPNIFELDINFQLNCLLT